jgi:hypothetical protein
LIILPRGICEVDPVLWLPDTLARNSEPRIRHVCQASISNLDPIPYSDAQLRAIPAARRDDRNGILDESG